MRALAEMGMTELTFSLLEPSQAAKFNDVITMRAWDIMLADPATSKSTINKINRMIKERQGITEKPDIGKALEGKPTPTAPQTVAPGTTPKPAGKEPAGKEKISKDMYNQLIAEGYTDEAIRAVYDVEP